MNLKHDDSLDTIGTFLLVVEFPIAMAVKAFGVMLMWGWFVTPIINVSGLSFWGALGLTLMIDFLSRPANSNKKEDMMKLAMHGAVNISVAIIIIIAAALVSLVV